jgi:hypothetical protein
MGSPYKCLRCTCDDPLRCSRANAKAAVIRQQEGSAIQRRLYDATGNPAHLRTTSPDPRVGNDNQIQEDHYMTESITLNVTVGPKDGRYLAVASNGDDVFGARADTPQAAAQRAVELWFEIAGDSVPQTSTAADEFAQTIRRRVGVATPTIREIIEDAIRRDQPVDIEYRDAAGHSTKREIDPSRITPDGVGGTELVECYDNLRGQIRNFRLDRIVKAESV